MDESPSSERRRPRRYAPVVLAVAALLAAMTPRPAQQARYDGEFGLWVETRADSVIVHWITQQAQAGRLEVFEGEHTVAAITTEPGFAHRAAFATPRQTELWLRYGGAGDDAIRHLTLVSLAAPRRAAVTLPAADSLYIVGDTHGMYDDFITGLQRAGLVDDEVRWSGGRRQLVLAGDLMDRGPDVIPLLWLVYRLEREAAAAGGAVHTVLGNHEIMVMLGDLRYVHAKETEIAELYGVRYDDMFDIDTSVLGRWLASKPGAIRVGDVAITHGGLHPEFAGRGLRALDDSLRTYMSEELFRVWSDTTVAIDIDAASFERRDRFFWAPESVFWHRAYVQSDTLDALLAEALRGVGATTLVVGHTPVDSIHTRYDGRLIASHTLRFGGELVLLVRGGGDYRRYRITANGTEPFED